MTVALTVRRGSSLIKLARQLTLCVSTAHAIVQVMYDEGGAGFHSSSTKTTEVSFCAIVHVMYELGGAGFHSSLTMGCAEASWAAAGADTLTGAID